MENRRFIEKIRELEDTIDDLEIKLDLAQCDVGDLRAENRALKGQLERLRVDRRYEVSVA